MIKRLILLIVLVLLLGGTVAYYLMPWNALLEERVTAFLNDRGLHDVSFKIDRVGLHEATINNIKIGQDDPLLINSLTVQYHPKELLDGNLQDIALTGLDVHVQQTETGWKVTGFEKIGSSSAEKKETFGLSDIADMLPFSSVDIKDSRLGITGKSIQTSLPFSLHLGKIPKTTLKMTVNASNLTAASSTASLGIVTIKAAPDEARNWNGEWALQSLDVGQSLPIPVVSGAGTLSDKGDVLGFEGALNSADKTYAASFTAVYDFKSLGNSKLTISSISFPFKQGSVSSKNIVIPFKHDKNITVNLDVKKVSLNELMQTLTGQKVTATGVVSGHVPVIIKPNGTYILGKGTLKADGEGLIQMPGNVIPGDNGQAELVRQILENLHYSIFSASVDSTGDHGMVVKLSLTGNNPDVDNGRTVKLNINLTGDLLDFIQQNVMLFTDPEQLLKQGTR